MQFPFYLYFLSSKHLLTDTERKLKPNRSPFQLFTVPYSSADCSFISAHETSKLHSICLGERD